MVTIFLIGYFVLKHRDLDAWRNKAMIPLQKCFGKSDTLSFTATEKFIGHSVSLSNHYPFLFCK